MTFRSTGVGLGGIMSVLAGAAEVSVRYLYDSNAFPDTCLRSP